jgi:hypothetical protein
MTLEEARRIVHQRMEHREEDFLRLVERNIYAHPPSPYLAVLKWAGCELGDVRALVKQKGLEGALRVLREQGVYVTYEEAKGRKPIVRKGLALKVTPRDFDNPNLRRDFSLRTSGSSGAATNVGAAFESMVAAAQHDLIIDSAHGVSQTPLALWTPGLPGWGLSTILYRSHFGRKIERWFSPVGWRESKYWLKYGLATVYMIVCCRALGLKLPLPKVVKVDQASVIAHWIADTLKERKGCELITGVSQASRVCMAAEQEGLDLKGAVFVAGGEPLTPAKAMAVKRIGAHIINWYGMVEAGMVGIGCARSDDAGDVHVAKDAFALITYPNLVENLGITVDALNLTTLRDTASKILLNFQADDYGVVEERSCGCELESYGWTTHLRDIRSYGKLVGEGVTLIGNEMLKILEQVLPSRFGGSALDYQLLEEEDEQGFTRLYLRIHPRVDIADEHEVIRVMLNSLRESSPMADAARLFWQQAQTIQVKRREPVWTGYKLHPLRVQRRQGN